MFEFQSQLIFPTHMVPSAGPLPRGAELLSLKTTDGHKLAGIHISADKPADEKTLILGFGGNGWNAQDVAEYLDGLFPDLDVVAFHYRGYAPSSGSPSAAALIADAPLIYDFVVEQMRPQRIVAAGFSIGSGIAAELGAQRQLDGLILVTPFDSLKAVAQSMYPWLPIAPFFAHEIDTAKAIVAVKAPVAILAGDRDEIVPAERTAALREKISNLVLDRTIVRAGHNDIYARSDFQAAMREALAIMLR